MKKKIINSLMKIKAKTYQKYCVKYLANIFFIFIFYMSRREDYSSDYDNRKCSCSKCMKKYEICYERNRCNNKIRHYCSCRRCSIEKIQDVCYNDSNNNCQYDNDNDKCKNKKVIVITIN
jgi:hypothetical protein